MHGASDPDAQDHAQVVYRRDEALKRAVLGQALTLYEKLTPSPTMTTAQLRESLGRNVV